MVVNFRARGINRSARKLARTSTLIKKKNYYYFLVSASRVWLLDILLMFFIYFNDITIVISLEIACALFPALSINVWLLEFVPGFFLLFLAPAMPQTLWSSH